MMPPIHTLFSESLAFGIGASNAYQQVIALTRRCDSGGLEFSSQLVAMLASERALWLSWMHLQNSFDEANNAYGKIIDGVNEIAPPSTTGVIVGALCYIDLFWNLVQIDTAESSPESQRDLVAKWTAYLRNNAVSTELCHGSAQAAARVGQAIEKLLLLNRQSKASH